MPLYNPGQEEKLINGKATIGSVDSLTDDTKDFTSTNLIGKTIGVIINNKTYFRDILDAIGNTLIFSPLPFGEKSIATLSGSGSDIYTGQVVVQVKEIGTNGDSYSVELVAGTGVSSMESISLVGNVLTITSGTTFEEVPTPLAAGNIQSLINNTVGINDVFEVVENIVAGSIEFTTEAIPFSGGSESTVVITGTRYFIWSESVLNSDLIAFSDTAGNIVATNVKSALTESAGKIATNYSKSNSNRDPVTNLSTHKIKRPIITFVDDDGNLAILSKLKPISERQGTPFVLGLIGHAVDSGASLTHVQALELQNTLGWEIASHGQTHTPMAIASLTEAEMDYEAKYSSEYLRSKGLDVKSFVYPGGTYDDTSKRIVSKYYNSAISTDVLVNTNPFRTYYLGRTSFPQAEPNNTLDYYKSLVDTAVTNNAWLIWMLHCGQPILDETQLQILEDLIVYIKSINVGILTVQQALDQSGNIININNGQFYMGADGTNNIRDYIVAPAVNNVEPYNFSTMPGDFPNNKTSACYVYNTITGSPSASRGWLVTTKSFAAGFTSQIFYSNLTNYYRQAADDATWSAWQRLFTGTEITITLDFGSIPSMGSASRDTSINGLAGGHYVLITNASITFPKGLIVSHSITGGWVLTVTVFNPTASEVTVGSVSFNALYMKKP